MRRGSALVFVLVLVVAMGAAVLTVIMFAAHVYGIESRSESKAVATMALDGAVADLRSEIAASTVLPPTTTAVTVGSLSVTCVISDYSGTIANTYKVDASVTVSGKAYTKSYVIGYDTGHGLTGEFFKSTSGYYDTLIFRRTDSTVNYNWGSGAPNTVVPADNFSVRWTGTITPTVSGSYTFTTTSDDGVRLWVNGQLLITNWTSHSSTNNTSAAVNLTSGQAYSIRLDYFEQSGSAVIALQWTPPSSSLQVIPASVLTPDPLPLASYSEADLSSAYNQDGYSYTSNKGDGNLGGSAKCFPAELLPSKLLYNGVHYDIGPMSDGANNVVKCTGQVLSMPSGNYSQVRILCVSTSGTQTDSWTLKYSDNSTTSSSPSLYDWRAGPTVGEDVAASFPYTYTSAAQDWTLANMQVITLTANPGKTLSSLTIPNRTTTDVLAVTCVN